MSAAPVNFSIFSKNNTVAKNTFLNSVAKSNKVARGGGTATGNISVTPATVITTGGRLTLQNGTETPVNFTITDGSTFGQLVEAINNANAGFEARIQNDGLRRPQFSISSTRRANLTVSGTAIIAGTFDSQTGINTGTYPVN